MCTVKRTNVICGHINKLSDRKLENTTQEMQMGCSHTIRADELNGSDP